MEYIKNIPDNSIDLIVTDPQYDVSATNGGGTINRVKKLNVSLKELSDANMDKGYYIANAVAEFIRVMKYINIYFWCKKKQIPEYFYFYVNKHGCKFDIICWHKTNALPTYSNKYLSDTEYLLYFHKGKGKCFPENYEDAKTYYIAPINHKDKKEWKHPTIKPLDITKKIIRNSSKKGDVVFDPFMGSGTTGVACIELDRKFIGTEINKEYFGIANDRLCFACTKETTTENTED